MTEKQLHKLRRQDLLELLLAQGREAAQLQTQLDEAAEKLSALEDTRTRFIERMNEKDAQIEKLTSRLNEKDAQIEKLTVRLNEKDAQIEKLIGRLNEKDMRIGELTREIEQYRSGEILGFEGEPSIEEISGKLNAIFKAAQKAVNQYLDSNRPEAAVTGQDTDTGTREDTGTQLCPDAGTQLYPDADIRLHADEDTVPQQDSVHDTDYIEEQK